MMLLYKTLQQNLFPSSLPFLPVSLHWACIYSPLHKGGELDKEGVSKGTQGSFWQCSGIQRLHERLNYKAWDQANTCSTPIGRGGSRAAGLTPHFAAGRQLEGHMMAGALKNFQCSTPNPFQARWTLRRLC